MRRIDLLGRFALVLSCPSGGDRMVFHDNYLFLCLSLPLDLQFCSLFSLPSELYY
jgi:hypothetical protein